MLRTVEEFRPLVELERLRWERERVRPAWSGGLTPAEFRERLEDDKARKAAKLAEEQRCRREWQAGQARREARRAELRMLIMEHQQGGKA